jgi:hypothetical protein
MADVTLYDVLGLSREQAREIAKKVRQSFSESDGPAEWIERLRDEFSIDELNAVIFACGWFAGKYAGVSEVFKAVQREIDEKEMDEAKKRSTDSKYSILDGYA